MGKPKHGKDSARTKSSAKYKAEGRRIINKQNKAAKIAAGKKIKSHKQPKTVWMLWDKLIRNTPQSKPYCDTTSGNVYWGKDKEDVREKEKIKGGK